MGMIFLAIAIGYCVHWVLPAVELGTACTMASITLATLVFCCAAFLVAGFVATAANHQRMEEDSDDEAEDEAEAARTIETISELVFQKMQDSVIHESRTQLRQSKKRVHR